MHYLQYLIVPGMDPLAKATSELVVEKTWQIPANGSKAGPVTVVVRMPNVLIIDSRGRHILVAPEQAQLVSAKMGEVAAWISNAAVS
ncbi:MAG TPA: hypothetical protein VFA63_08805 [Pseudonocardiaceae bacterium]|nr:hypothetical protein [Pseudonocardiaceae bacterium]